MPRIEHIVTTWTPELEIGSGVGHGAVTTRIVCLAEVEIVAQPK